MRIRKPSPAMVVASVALLMATTGTATATTQFLLTGANIKDGSIRGVDVKNGSLKSIDVQNGSLKSIDVKNGSLKSVDVKDGSLLVADFAAGQLPAGTQGPQGSQGPQGPEGPQGPPGVSGHEIVLAASPMNSDSLKAVVATCPAGKKPLGGGAAIWPPVVPVLLVASHPFGPGGWLAEAREPAPFAGPWSLRAYAVCATVAA